MRQLFLITLLYWQQALVPPASTEVVSGTVFYSDGTPAANTPLRLTPVGQQPPGANLIFGIVGATGSFNIRVAPGRYLIRTSTPVPVYYPGVLNEAEAKPVVVTAGSPAGGISFTMPPSASGVRLHGRVTIPANYSATPTSLRVDLMGPRVSAPIAEDRTFEFTHMMPGTYRLTVALPGVQPVMVTVADRDVTDIDLIIPPLIPVRGTVALDGSGARPRFSLQFGGLFPAGGSVSTPPYAATVVVMPDGAFSTALPPGEYRLLLNDLPEGYYLKTISRDAMNLFANPVNVLATDTSIRIAIGLGMSPKVHVSGRVTGSANQIPSSPLEKISLTGVAVNESVEAVINPEGGFDFPRVTPGTYLARVALTRSVSSPPSVMTIPNKSVSDLEVSVPDPREIYGKVAVDGNGPPPKFSLLLVRGAKSTAEPDRPGILPTVAAATLVNQVQSGGSAGAQVLQIDVNALADGTFRMKVPDGEYRVATGPAGLGPAAIPPAYFLRSLTSSSADLMTEPLRVSEETTQIHAGFGTTTPNPWVKVSGRVSGLDSSKGVFRVALESNTTSAIETYIDAEGKFEFPAVLQRSTYTARLVPSIPIAPSPRVVVADKDVTDVQIHVPAERDMIIRVSMDDNSSPPGFGLSMGIMVVVRPEPDGTFKVKLPEDERNVTITGLPLGYSVKSITYGSSNLLKQPLKIGGSTNSEIQIRLGVDPDFPFGSLRGRVTGVDADKGAVRIVLNGLSTFSTFESTLNADGSFNFPRLPQGIYVPSLSGAIVATRLGEAPITVSGPDLAGIEFAAPQQLGQASRMVKEEPPSGAIASDFPGGGRAAANESAAVANLRTINTALVTYLASSGGKYGTLPQLIEAGLLDKSFTETRSGFNYSIVASGSVYAAVAIPANSAAGRFGYYSEPSAVIRYSTFEFLAPPQQGGRAVQ
jgi:hypothetical protein